MTQSGERKVSPTSLHDAASPRVAALLDAIPDAALLIDRDRRVLATNRKFRSIFGEKGETHGRHCYELCHYLDQPCDMTPEVCPLDRCLVTRDRVKTLHVHASQEGDVHTEVIMRPLFDDHGEPDSFLEVLRPIRVASARPSRDRLVGRSPAFNSMLQNLERIARTDKPVLIVGEGGTGKELVARAVHESSPRSSGPIVPVDCQALREWQFERELFGHDVGAFPGAETARPGLVGAATGGTLFLREVETLTHAVQVRLLRLLDSGRYLPEGANHTLQADFRLICSSQQDLKDLVARGMFREDLRLRIGSFPLDIPPLRDRLEDIPILTESLLRRLSCAPSCREAAPAALELLQAYDFPGNIRELTHLLERACMNAEGSLILPEHLPDECRRPARPDQASLLFDGTVVALEEAESRYIAWARHNTDCSQRELARRLGISERTLYRRLGEIASQPAKESH